MAKNQLSQLGGIAFLVGIVGAIALGLLSGLGFFELGGILGTILVFSGIAIGLLNIAVAEATSVMVASLVLGAGSGVGSQLPFLGNIVSSILGALAIVVIPLAVVVAVVTIWNKAKK